MIKSSLFALGAALFAGAATGAAARADVAWQHSGRIAWGTGARAETLATFDFNNQWSGANHRTFLRYDATSMAETAMMESPTADDAMAQRPTVAHRAIWTTTALIFVAPGAESYLDEPYSTLKSRLRLEYLGRFGPHVFRAQRGNSRTDATNSARTIWAAKCAPVLSPFTRRLSRIYLSRVAGPSHHQRFGVSRLPFYGMLVNSSGKAKPVPHPMGARQRRVVAHRQTARRPGNPRFHPARQPNQNRRWPAHPVDVGSTSIFRFCGKSCRPKCIARLRTHDRLRRQFGLRFSGHARAVLRDFSDAPKKPSAMNARATRPIRFALELKKPLDKRRRARRSSSAPTGLKKQPIEPFLQLVRKTPSRRAAQEIREIIGQRVWPAPGHAINRWLRGFQPVCSQSDPIGVQTVACDGKWAEARTTNGTRYYSVQPC